MLSHFIPKYNIETPISLVDNTLACIDAHSQFIPKYNIDTP